jgi:hypothetical protein
MKLIRNVGLAVLLIWLVNSCFTAPTYPIVPQIEYSDIYYGKSTDGGFDSIVVALIFKDGDGDIGLDDRYNNDQTFVLQNYFTFQNQPVTYKTKRLNPNLQGTNGKPLPNFITPFNCTNWEVRRVNNIVTDTLYTELNPNYYNIFVDFYVDGVFFDPASYFIYPNCSPAGYSGRLPVLSIDPGKNSPLDGKITYAIKGFAFDLLFSIKQLELKITIQDRALHKSNTITTGPFTLASKRR